MKVTMRFDLRHPPEAAGKAELYSAMLDICEWADELGLDEVFLGEHHAAEDGYIPSPVIAASAVAARTRSIGIHLSALLLPFYEPLKLAEDLAVVDIVSRGRLRLTVGMGYRPHEFEMFGLDRKSRLDLMLESIEVLEQAWSGEPFGYRGRTVRVTPTPFRQGGPQIILGGSSEASAIRAARLGYEYRPGYPPLYDRYKAELSALGRPDPPPPSLLGPLFIYLTRDPEADWPVVGPYAVYTANSYVAWNTEREGGTTTYRQRLELDEARNDPRFMFMTPKRFLDFATATQPHDEVQLQPLFGGLPPDLAWRSLRLFEAEVLPELRSRGLHAIRQ